MSPVRLAALFLSATASALPAPAVAESWILRTDLWGNPTFSTLTIDRAGKEVSGDLDGDRITGRASGDRLTLTATDSKGSASIYTLRLRYTELSGTTDMADTNDPAVRASHAVTGWRVPERSGGARTVEFTPTDYSNSWNADRRPVLIVWPGDTIHTTTVDSGGGG